MSSLSPSYDEARKLINFYDARRATLDGADLGKAQLYASLAVAESLMAIEGLLRAQDARARVVKSDARTDSED